MSNNFNGKDRINALRAGCLRLSVVKDPDVCMRIVNGMSKNIDAIEQKYRCLEYENAELKENIKTLMSLLPDDVVALLK